MDKIRTELKEVHEDVKDIALNQARLSERLDNFIDHLKDLQLDLKGIEDVTKKTAELQHKHDVMIRGLLWAGALAATSTAAALVPLLLK